MGNGLQDQSLSFEALYEQARSSVPVVEALGHKIIADLQAKNPGMFDTAEFQNGPLKSFDRAVRKIEGDYKGRHHEISDLARGRILADTPEQIKALRTYFEENADTLGIEKKKDRFAEPGDTEFRDLNTKMRLPNGHVIEFRVEHRGMIEASKLTHDPYEEVQLIERTATIENRMMTDEEAFRRQMILDQIRDIHAKPAEEASLNDLLNEKGWKTLAEHEAKRVTPRSMPDTLIANAPSQLAAAFAKNAVAAEFLAQGPDLGGTLSRSFAQYVQNPDSIGAHAHAPKEDFTRKPVGFIYVPLTM